MYGTVRFAPLNGKRPEIILTTELWQSDSKIMFAFADLIARYLLRELTEQAGIGEARAWELCHIVGKSQVKRERRIPLPTQVKTRLETFSLFFT